MNEEREDAVGVRKLFGAVLLATAAALLVAGPARGYDPLSERPVIKAGQYAEANWPEQFAGFWLDFDYWDSLTPAQIASGPGMGDDQKAFFAFTGGAEEKVAELRRLFPGSNPYVAVDHNYSYATLRALQADVTADLRAYAEGALDIPGPAFRWYSTGVSVTDNVVEVSLSAVSPEYEAWAARRYSPLAPALSISAGQEIFPLAGGPGSDGGKAVSPGRAAENGKKTRKRLRKKCRRAGRVAVRTGSPRAKKFARSSKCRAVR